MSDELDAEGRTLKEDKKVEERSVGEIGFDLKYGLTMCVWRGQKETTKERRVQLELTSRLSSCKGR